MPMGVPMHPRSRALSAMVLAVICACAGTPPREVARQAANGATAEAALEGPPMVRLQVGDGPISKPVVHPAFGKAALVLRFPEECAGAAADVVVERVQDRVRTPWLTLALRVRPDGSVPIAGLDAGAYVVTARPAVGPQLVGSAEVAPAESRAIELRAAPAAPRR